MCSPFFFGPELTPKNKKIEICLHEMKGQPCARPSEERVSFTETKSDVIKSDFKKN